MTNVILIADPIALTNRDPKIYTSQLSPRELAFGHALVEGPIPAGATYAENQTVFSYQPTLTPAQIDEELGRVNYKGLIVAAKTVTNPAVEFAVRIGAGTNNLDKLKDKGIVVMNTPGFNSQPTADAMVYALNQVLSPDPAPVRTSAPTDLYTQTRDVFAGNPRANSSDLSAYYHGGWPEFTGTKSQPKKIAIIGAGHIGGLAADKLRLDKHKIVTYSRSNTKQAANPVEAARGADVIIVQTPLTDATRGIINAEVIAAANQGVVIVNAARSEVVDMQALKGAMLGGHIGGLIADLDYFPDKPNSPMQPYIDIVREAQRAGMFYSNDRRLILSPHTFADTHDPSRQAGGMQAIFQMLWAINRAPGFSYINQVNAGTEPTIVQDGLNRGELNPFVSMAVSGDFASLHNAGSSYQFQFPAVQK